MSHFGVSLLCIIWFGWCDCYLIKMHWLRLKFFLQIFSVRRSHNLNNENCSTLFGHVICSQKSCSSQCSFCRDKKTIWFEMMTNVFVRQSSPNRCSLLFALFALIDDFKNARRFRTICTVRTFPCSRKSNGSLFALFAPSDTFVRSSVDPVVRPIESPLFH